MTQLTATIDGLTAGTAAFGNSGQICIVTTRRWLHADIEGCFAIALTDVARVAKVGDGIELDVDVGPMQKKAQYARVVERIDGARANDSPLPSAARCRRAILKRRRAGVSHPHWTVCLPIPMCSPTRPEGNRSLSPPDPAPKGER